MLVNVVISLNYSRLIANAKTLMYISSTKQNCKNNNFQNRFAKPGLPLFRQTVLTQMYATNTDGQKKQKKLENAFYADYPVLIFFFFFFIPVCWGKKHIYKQFCNKTIKEAFWKAIQACSCLQQTLLCRLYYMQHKFQ